MNLKHETESRQINVCIITHLSWGEDKSIYTFSMLLVYRSIDIIQGTQVSYYKKNKRICGLQYHRGFAPPNAKSPRVQ